MLGLPDIAIEDYDRNERGSTLWVFIAGKGYMVDPVAGTVWPLLNNDGEPASTALLTLRWEDDPDPWDQPGWDEPDPDDWNPGPEVDDEGGMSEYRHMDHGEEAP